METFESGQTPHELVLLIDDSSIDNFVNQKMIERNNFAKKVITFTKVKDALNYLIKVDENKSYGTELPSIIFLDIEMPVVDGHEFIKFFKTLSEEIKNNCKIIILTNVVNPDGLNVNNEQRNILTILSKPLMKINFDFINFLLPVRVPVKT